MLPTTVQPVQGISALRAIGGGRFLALVDNGYGLRENSKDFFLRVYELQLSHTSSSIVIKRAIPLSDPHRFLNFPLVVDDESGSFSEEERVRRILTGGDLDPESLAVTADGTLWIGEEFGPFLLKFSPNGELLQAPIEIPLPSALASSRRGMTVVRSPDHPAVRLGQSVQWNLPRSRGIESMALAPQGDRLVLLLEGPLLTDRWDRLLLLEFDLATEQFASEVKYYRLTRPHSELPIVERHKVGELVFLDDTRILVVETDDGHGREGPRAATHKIVYEVDLQLTDYEGFLIKRPVVDLLRLPGTARSARGIVSDFPFVTIEGIERTDDGGLVIVNDNNFPSWSGRERGRLQDTEFLMIFRGCLE